MLLFTRVFVMIKNNLSKLLGEKRLTQADLARATGIRPATINELYHELAERISFEQLDRICEVLKCDVADLLIYLPNKEKKTGKNLLLEEHKNRKKTYLKI